MDEVTKVSIDRLNDENVRQNHRIDTLEREIAEVRSIAVSVERLAINMDNMLSELKKQGEKIDKLEAEPADNWMLAKRAVISTVVGALAGAMCAGAMAMFL